MKISFDDGSYISFGEHPDGMNMTMAHKKADGTYSASSFTFSKTQTMELTKFLVKYLEVKSYG